jgi:hypothetical protein
MVGKIIEKVYKYTIPTPQELFQMFQEKFSKAMLPDSWQVSEPWTAIVLNIFDGIGRSLGYMPKREYLRLDQTWEVRLKDISVIVLALEYENEAQVGELLDDELQKLLDVKAFLKVLIFYPATVFPMTMMSEEEFVIPEIQEKIRSAKIMNPDEKYVIIGIRYIRSDNVIDVSACSFDSEGKGEDLGAFQVSYTSKD